MYKVGLIVIATLLVVLPALGAQMNIAAKDKDDAQPGRLSAVQLAGQLADYGVANRDAVALVEAARIRARLGGQEATREKTTEGEAGLDGVKSDDAGPDTVGTLLATARSLAGESEIVLALIEEVEAMGTKGVRGGPVYHQDRVRARMIDVYSVTFRGGELAELAVSGDGDTDLDLYIYDENGNSICRDRGSTDQAYCSWRPRWTGEFKVKVRNLGPVYNRYHLVTN